ncbi:hybrid sensor histidine kinase/response regulator [Pacificibacter marinus]|uniref:histidine kinase n=1 Tax=Pacificibacter marinus TaxID=658057 RepID=A0A1Y5RBG2_9RHOB|nr:response regulator [Pacificibacter marinus]SEK24772.1 Histidine kinase-, DNA gyrase B-, and HSP90-like ATPase [Pacificibacter marinus]SLN13519.1 Sensor protein EvgS precursor [Pacificibacter marinus]
MTEQTKKPEQTTTVQVADAGMFSFLSHDIRSAFSEVSDGLSALSQTSQDPQSREAVRRMIAANDHLGRLLRDALTLVVGEHAIQPQEYSDTNIKDFLTVLIARWGKTVATQGAALEFKAETSLPEVIQIDVLALERILSNIVSNAARHANGKKIEVGATYTPSQGLCVHVRDHGAGFSQEQLPILFDFPPAPVGAGEPGSGYGLRIAYSLSQRIGGTLTAENAADGGAILTLEIPLEKMLEQSPLMAVETLQVLLKGRKALVVDDGAVHRIALRAQLEAIGVSVTEADCGADAIEALENQHFDLLFLDIEMPIISGLDLLRILKDRTIPVPPTIGVTSHAFERNHRVIKDAGAFMVLNKPVSNAAYLHSTILSALHLGAAPDESTSSAEILHQQHDPISGLKTLVETLNPSVRKPFLEQLDTDLTMRLQDATAAASHNLSQRERIELARTAHALAGLFATCYAHEAHQMALTLEYIALTEPRAEVIALLSLLSQDAEHIKKKIHLLKQEK